MTGIPYFAPHGGDIYGTHKIRQDFSVNINPLGMPESIQKAVAAHPEDWLRYPDIHCRALREKLAAYYGQQGFSYLDANDFICGNGASDVLYSLVFALRPKKALLPVPCFGEYRAALEAGGCQVLELPLQEEAGFLPELSALLELPVRSELSAQLDLPVRSGLSAQSELPDGGAGSWDDIDWLVIGNPNNPTGLALTSEQMEELAAFCLKKGIFLVVDECFQWFLDDADRYSSLRLLKQYENVFLLNAFTKIFAMAGLRLGYGICRDRSVLERIASCRQPWSVSGPAMRAGLAALEVLEGTGFQQKTGKLVREEREFLIHGLESLGFTVIPSRVNYILFQCPWEMDLAGYCLERGILIRSCANYTGLAHRYYRVAVKLHEENKELLDCLSGAVEER